MLRLRLESGAPRDVASGDEFRLRVVLTNESGSVVALSAPCLLAAAVHDAGPVGGGSAADAETAPTLPAVCSLSASSSAGGGKARAVSLPEGRPAAAELRMALTLGARAAGRAYVDVRVRVRAGEGGARLAAPAGAPAGGASALPPLPVAALMSPVVRVWREQRASADAAAASAAAEAALDENALASDVSPFGSLLAVPFWRPPLRVLERPSVVAGGFGSIVWDCALALLLGLARAGPGGVLPAATAWAGARVVDVGCGTGALGVAVATLGATVALTDLPAALPLVRANAAANAAAVERAGGAAVVLPLSWGARVARGAGDGDADAGAVLPLAPPAGEGADGEGAHDDASGAGAPVARGSSSQAPVAFFVGAAAAARSSGFSLAGIVVPVDVVLASEVAYRAEAFRPLVATLAALLGCADAPSDAEEEGGRGTGGRAPAARSSSGGGVTLESAAGPSRRCPLLLLAARRRASCDLADFLALLRERFHVEPLAGTPAGWTGAPEDWDALTGVPAVGVGAGASGPPALARGRAGADVDAFVGAAARLSKTGYAPMLFRAWPRAWRAGGRGGGAGSRARG